MKGRKRDIRDLLASGEYRPGRHEHLLPVHARAAYERAGGGTEGRRAALELLDTDADGLDRLHRAAYAPGWAELAILYAGAWPPPPERQGMWDELAAARVAYAQAMGGPHGSFVVGPPEDPQVCLEWEADLLARIRALPDHNESEFEFATNLRHLS